MDKPEYLPTDVVESFVPSNEQKLKFEQILNKAQSFDLRPIVQRYMNKRGVTRARAIEIVDEMLIYLSLCATEPNEQWTITGEVDEMWHTFILFTERYEKFCKEIAGSFIHHYPSEDNLSEEQNDSEITITINPEKLNLSENNDNITDLKNLLTTNDNFSKLYKGNPAIVCKPINNPTDKNDSMVSYGNTLKKYLGYLGTPPKKGIWPSPGVLGKPDAPRPCDGGSGSGPICDCKIRTDPSPPKK
ncbi:glycine-rich domain-containing protein [Flavobacterium chungangense]|uniref:Uncharacterized protein n=1 Tax=Flavobacterium chungangense TaxID=554283 RepID=A0A6V6ZDJ2_9FLAO|nr:hypothetical protein [Flavobacterium chungangense]CAD0009877.1 hypothetical protein FLACHUCJ7_04517 [Flavobacterium chungangense]